MGSQTSLLLARARIRLAQTGSKLRRLEKKVEAGAGYFVRNRYSISAYLRFSWSEPPSSAFR
jgi:hypothetical protein